MKTIPLIELAPKDGWLTMPQPRLQTLADEEMSLTARSFFKLMLRVGKAKCPNLFRTMFRNLRIYFHFARFNATVMPYGRMQRRHTELAILRGAWLSRSYYEWGQHVEIGLSIGLTPDDIERVSRGADAEGWSTLDVLVIRASDEMFTDHQISDQTWLKLSQELSEKLMLELMFLISGYNALACVLNSSGVVLEPEIEQILRDTQVSVPS